MDDEEREKSKKKETPSKKRKVEGNDGIAGDNKNQLQTKRPSNNMMKETSNIDRNKIKKEEFNKPTPVTKLQSLPGMMWMRVVWVEERHNSGSIEKRCEGEG